MNNNEQINLSKEQKEVIKQFVIKSKDEYLTPQQIVYALDKFIIGQQAAKKAVAIALRNRWRRQHVKSEIKDEIMPNNIIMIGPTGVGKTEIARRLARLADAPFIKVEATKFTEVGYVGRDVESMVRDLVDRSVAMVMEEKTQEKRVEAEISAENRILDILIPPIKKTRTYIEDNEEDEESNKQTREKFRKMLREGKLNEKLIEIDVLVESVPSMQLLGPIGLDEMGMNLQDLFGSILPKKNKKRKLKIKEAIKLLENEEAEKLIDMDAVIKEASERAQNSGIIFIDEIDKIASTGITRSGPDVSREGVQRDLLPVVEGCSVNTKYGPVNTEHILFIASGAFHTTKPSDLIPELQGRFPIRVELKSLTKDDFIKILTLPENALIKQYKALLEAEDIEIEFSEDAIQEIASMAAYVNEEVTNIGARRLHTIMTTLLEDILFSAPNEIDDKKILITDDVVKEKLKDIVKNTDLSRFIL